MANQDKSSFLFMTNAPYIEELYEKYLQNATSVSAEWRSYFDQVHQASEVKEKNYLEPIHEIISVSSEKTIHEIARKQVGVQSLIGAYRFLGNRRANLDPLKRKEKPKIAELEPSFYGLNESDMGKIFSTTNTYFGADSMTLKELIQALEQTYCGSIGIEYMYISDPVIKRWWQEKLESIRSEPTLSDKTKRTILSYLTEAEGLERYLHTRYVGQKRFSLEGGESFIVSMNHLVELATQQGLEEVVIGMAHRGRLNVLVNVLGKSPKDLFAEFEGKYSSMDLPAGDVKYHNGFSSDILTTLGPIHLSLAFNPSHLEIVDPVVAGSVRARQDQKLDYHGKKVMGVMVHGDAAFAGQGVVMETLNLADTRGYGIGGTFHIVINNQIGFTTSDPRDKGSMTYSTDPAKLIEAPVLHVNGDDPESVVLATQLAMEFRNQFSRDVVLDIVCFRRLGHNEQDTPSLTQPLMYRKIDVHPGTRALYGTRLVEEGILKDSDVKKLIATYRRDLENGIAPRKTQIAFDDSDAMDWSRYDGRWTDYIRTAVPENEIIELGEILTTVPEHFKLHPLLQKVINDRKAMLAEQSDVDWGLAEHLAFATLLSDGYSVRISGEDSGRGTFSHRHAVWHDQNRERWDSGTWIPLEHLFPNQGRFTVIDSVLSEEAVLGYEYGYALSSPKCLTIWEAQFGDFANGAQVVIDQFISSGEAKWGRRSGLTMMLPHGYEGQGPEHSSARVERYLQLASDHNMLIMQPTTAAQIFHLLRRQMLGTVRKPLIIFTPKSLLRNKSASSPLQALSEGVFLPVIGETDAIEASDVRRIILCTGKVYYELHKKRSEKQLKHVALIRVEQLYPFPEKELEVQMNRYPSAEEIVWVQDEPQNQGAWTYMTPLIWQLMKKGQTLAYAGREASSSPAVGYATRHHEQLKTLLEDAFADELKEFKQTK